MNDFKNEEIKYCTHCGSANKKSALFCEECERKISTSYRPFYDFLKNHTKDEIKGTVTDTFFSLLKKYLMSHVYGIVLSVSIVATAVSAAYATTPYIEKINNVNTNTPVVEEPQEEVIPLTDDDIQDFEHLATNCDSFADMFRASEGYWMPSSDYGSASEMYAENNIEGYSYSGVHEMVSNPINMYYLDDDPNFNSDGAVSVDYNSNRYTDTSSSVTGANCTSELAKKLHNDGYRVAECNYVLVESADVQEEDDSPVVNFTKKLVYKFVFVEYNGEWYIAEDRLIERENV